MRVARYLLGFGGRVDFDFDFEVRTYGLGNFRAFPLAVAAPSLARAWLGLASQSARSSLLRSGDRLPRQPGRRFIPARGVISATRRLWRPCVQNVSDARFHRRETLLLSLELGLT